MWERPAYLTDEGKGPLKAAADALSSEVAQYVQMHSLYF